MKTIIAAINLLIAAAFGALKIYKVSKGDGEIVDKVKAVRDELVKIIDKLDSLAKTTDPTWDDTLASALSVTLESVASVIIENLEGES